jgi:SAM-dependent methyltransferase
VGAVRRLARTLPSCYRWPARAGARAWAQVGGTGGALDTGDCRVTIPAGAHARFGLRVRLQHAPVAAAWLRCRGRGRLAQLHRARAQRADPGGTYLVCDAAHVPLADRSFDGILCLDVLEHVTNERAVLAETARLLKPGGTLVLTVPHSGLLAGLDSPNLFGRLVHATRRGLFPPEIAATGCHRHYAVDGLAVDDLRALVGNAFTLVRVRRTGLGVAELVHLPGLLLFRWLLQIEPLYAGAAFAYYTVYVLEDVVPARPGWIPLAVGRQARRDVARSADSASAGTYAD